MAVRSPDGWHWALDQWTLHVGDWTIGLWLISLRKCSLCKIGVCKISLYKDRPPQHVPAVPLRQDLPFQHTPFGDGRFLRSVETLLTSSIGTFRAGSECPLLPAHGSVSRPAADSGALFRLRSAGRSYCAAFGAGDDITGASIAQKYTMTFNAHDFTDLDEM